MARRSWDRQLATLLVQLLRMSGGGRCASTAVTENASHLRVVVESVGTLLANSINVECKLEIIGGLLHFLLPPLGNHAIGGAHSGGGGGGARAAAAGVLPLLEGVS